MDKTDDNENCDNTIDETPVDQSLETNSNEITGKSIPKVVDQTSENPADATSTTQNSNSINKTGYFDWFKGLFSFSSSKRRHSGDSIAENSSQPKNPRIDNTPHVPSAETNTVGRSLKENGNEAISDNQQNVKTSLKEEKIQNARAKVVNALREKIHQRKIEVAQNYLPQEPSADTTEKVITFAIRFPSGSTIRRNFLQTDILLTLYNFVISRDDIPVQFDIVRYPNEIIPVKDDEAFMTFQEYGFKRNELIHIRDLTEE